MYKLATRWHNVSKALSDKLDSLVYFSNPAHNHFKEPTSGWKKRPPDI